MTKVLYHPETGVPGVEVATRADEEQLFTLLSLLHAENGWFSMNPQKVRDGIRLATQPDSKKGCAIIYVIRKDSRIVASLGMLIVTDWYSDDEYLLERWNYVHPDFRQKSDYARKLIEQAKWTSDWFTRSALKSGYPPMPVQVGINSLVRTEGKVRLYSRHMVCVGAFFMYGQLPKQNKAMQEEVRRLKEFNLKAHKERSGKADPLVETILSVGKSEDDYVRQQG